MAAVEQPDIRIEDARPRHLDAVMRLEELCFPTPWSRASYEQEIAHRRSIFRVATDGGLTGAGVSGYVCSWVVADECHILKIAVDPDYRRCGIASALLVETLASAVRAGARMAYLEVRPSNGEGIAFYESHGFVPIGRRPGYYADTGEDALLYFRSLS